MALIDANGNPIAPPAPDPAPAAAAQPLIDVNKLRTAFSTSKTDIPLFYTDTALDNVNEKKILIGQNQDSTYHIWMDKCNYSRKLSTSPQRQS